MALRNSVLAARRILAPQHAIPRRGGGGGPLKMGKPIDHPVCRAIRKLLTGPALVSCAGQASLDSPTWARTTVLADHLREAVAQSLPCIKGKAIACQPLAMRTPVIDSKAACSPEFSAPCVLLAAPGRGRAALG